MWFVLVLAVAVAVSKLFNRTGDGLVFDIVIGFVGAILLSRVVMLFGQANIPLSIIESSLVAIGGTALALIGYNKLFRRAQ
jgi:uncharacterized membrane protein YeaQ/YmgE (transglycosylase-associated protein family)